MTPRPPRPTLFPYTTLFRSQIYAIDGALVYDQPPVPVADLSRNRRRDFFLRTLLTIPADLQPGQYRLKVAITDTQANKIAQAVKNFQIVAEETP